MKKAILAVATLAAFMGVARAQSTVTLYGIVDESLTYTNNIRGSSRFGLDSGMLQGSRFGLKGSEDLGGGLKTIFQLENGFNASTGALGQGSRMFGRQAYVGLSSATFGNVTLGRQYDSVVDYVASMTATGSWAGAPFAHPFDNDNMGNSFRIDNAVKYTSVKYGGFQFGGLYGFSNAAGGFADNRAWSVGARYTSGPLTLGAAYLDLNGINTNTSGGAYADSANAIGGIVGQSFGTQRIGGVGASYVFGSAIASVTGSQSMLSNPTAYVRFTNIEGNVLYSFTPAFKLGVMYTYTHLTSSQKGEQFRPHFHMLGIMPDYFLSKRTDLYAQLAWQNGSSGTASFYASSLVGVPGSGGYSNNDNQVNVSVGIRHKF